MFKSSTMVSIFALSALAFSGCSPKDKPTESKTQSEIKTDTTEQGSRDAGVLAGAQTAVSNTYPSRVLWGDTHLHTDLSLDARGFGVTLSPDDAYRFARGEEVISSNGMKAKLSRPLDFLAVSDHSDGIGAMKEIIAGTNEHLMSDPKVAGWNKTFNTGPKGAEDVLLQVLFDFTQGKMPQVLVNDDFSQSIWNDYTEAADQFNEPGKFTAMVAYEWTSNPDGGDNLHRNVLYRAGADSAKKMLPFTVADSPHPEDLWKWMQAYEDKTGTQVLAIPHNGNLSNGLMYPVETNHVTGKPLEKSYVEARARWEPIAEVTQIKGDGEAHPFLSPDDEFADYETWDKRNLLLTKVNTKNMLQYEYAREALKNGLKLESMLGTNPYKFGMIGATDSHTALATADENNFYGKHAGTEPSPERLHGELGRVGDHAWYAKEMVASGYAGVWAHENTRESIFDAMMRKEVYATTGPRMTVRVFGGWDFDTTDLGDMAATGYAKGVPMGGTLKANMGEKPAFMISAMKDPESGNLDRVQVIKGWLDGAGETHEKIYDVVWAGDRKIGAAGKLPSVGNTVDVKNASWKNTIGETELKTVWRDEDYDPSERAFYYVRVIEIPTPSWRAYDAKRFNVRPSPDMIMETRERAYTSPIWIDPKG